MRQVLGGLLVGLGLCLCLESKHWAKGMAVQCLGSALIAW